jgi:hypothetical protein
VLVGALTRRAQAEGGFAAILQKGDATSGSVVVWMRDRNGSEQLLERLMGGTGDYAWRQTARRGDQQRDDLEGIVNRRRQFDPDLWVVELDVASAERFVAGMNEVG